MSVRDGKHPVRREDDRLKPRPVAVQARFMLPGKPGIVAMKAASGDSNFDRMGEFDSRKWWAIQDSNL